MADTDFDTDQPQPPISTDNTAPDSQPTPQPQPTPSAPASASNGVLGYLLGDGAADPTSVTDDGIENLKRLNEAVKNGGPEAAWPLLQANRKAYNMAQSLASAALTGTDGKPADPNGAALAATRAAAHVLDGSDVKFSAGDDGNFTATVTGGNGAGTYKLTPDQMKEYLNTGGAGQYDKLLAIGGVPIVLKQLTAGGNNTTQSGSGLSGGAPAPKPQSPPAGAVSGYNPAQDTQGGYINNPAVRAGHAMIAPNGGNQPALPGMFDRNGHYIGPKVPDKTQYGPQLEARSRAMFPSVGQEQARQRWMQEQEDAIANNQNKLDVANAGMAGKERIAKIQAGSRESVAQTRADSYKDVEASRSKDRQAKIKAAALNQAARLAQQATSQDDRNRLAAFRTRVQGSLVPDDATIRKIADETGVTQLLGRAIAPSTTMQNPAEAAPPPVAAPSSGSGSQPSANPSGGMPTVKTQADWAKLPSGTRYIGPDGKAWIKK